MKELLQMYVPLKLLPNARNASEFRNQSFFLHLFVFFVFFSMGKHYETNRAD